ncbi:MAG: hypothetical protein WCF26_10710 [Candidatus Sulfotelmatobacter sp.]
MRTHRVWIEIVMFGSGIACALALLFAIIAATAGAAVGQMKGSGTDSVATEPRAYEGMVTCSHCGARHSAALGQTASTCVRVCVHGGSQFALVNADAIYLLDGDRDALKRVAGQRARIVGNLEGKTIQVQSVVAER